MSVCSFAYYIIINDMFRLLKTNLWLRRGLFDPKLLPLFIPSVRENNLKYVCVCRVDPEST